MKLSILIAAYNVEKFIEKCVLSCCDQDLLTSEYEIIIIDDDSSDSTLNILEKLQEMYVNVRVYNQENSGLGAVRNKGVLKAIGSYVWFIDGDDFLESNILKKILHNIESKNLETLVLNYNIVDEQGHILGKNVNEIEISQKVISGSKFYNTNYSKSYTWSFIFKRELFVENKVFFKERINMQDSEILPKLMFHVDRIAFLNEACYNYVQQPNSFTNTINSAKRYRYFESIVEVEKSLQDFLKKDVANNELMKEGLEKKIEGLQHVIFNHLIFFNYDKEWLLKIIKLLKRNSLYPLKHKAKGKMKLLKIGLNNWPLVTKWVVDKMLSTRKSYRNVN